MKGCASYLGRDADADVLLWLPDSGAVQCGIGRIPRGGRLTCSMKSARVMIWRASCKGNEGSI